MFSATSVQPTNARVLEIRPRAGTIAESLRQTVLTLTFP